MKLKFLARQARETGLGLRELFYPFHCLGCGCKIDREIFCAGCYAQIEPAPGPVAVHFQSAARYCPPLSLAIQHFKYRQQTWLTGHLAALMTARFPLLYETRKPNCLVPVPLFSARRRTRGFNQAELLAREIGAAFTLPVLTDVLIRTRDTRSQASLSRKERLENVAGAFVVTGPAAIQNKACLLVDDVITTGATLSACRRALLAGGAGRVLGFTLARD